MQKSVFIAFLLTCAAGMAFAQAYKWVDENGVVHYSDRPQPGAEEVQIETGPARRPVVPRTTPASDAEPVAEPEEEDYVRLDIATPQAEETLWNIQGILNVSLALEPGLKPGHQVRIYFDGEARMVLGTSFQIPEVFRGVHNIQAEIVDSRGNLQIRSDNHRFYVQQTSVLNTNRPTVAPR